MYAPTSRFASAVFLSAALSISCTAAEWLNPDQDDIVFNPKGEQFPERERERERARGAAQARRGAAAAPLHAAARCLPRPALRARARAHGTRRHADPLSVANKEPHGRHLRPYHQNRAPQAVGVRPWLAPRSETPTRVDASCFL